jgi:hypothetical protein
MGSEQTARVTWTREHRNAIYEEIENVAHPATHRRGSDRARSVQPGAGVMAAVTLTPKRLRELRRDSCKTRQFEAMIPAPRRNALAELFGVTVPYLMGWK